MGKCNNTKCPLFGKTEVPYYGNTGANVVFIGESPGRQELVAREPFVGDAGVKIKNLVIS